jgi:hypothetical protein
MSLDGSSPDRGEPPNFYLLKVHKKLAFPDLKRAAVDPDTSFRPRGAERIRKRQNPLRVDFLVRQAVNEWPLFADIVEKSETGVPRQSPLPRA